ncbi:tyrosine-type recombinase/integrase [Succinimonas amylolytica]|uniref:tyrosine-type recombinase/integrase n=1 Tax=Succinimonas amylolytica TaxID=83769 RepID=UPI00035F388E|nr:tyrosine-type recombinase/integrase [Succinimonas amylolytica]
MSTSTTDFACSVSEFLTEYLPLQRNYSKNTILSYRDALKLLVVFITDTKGIRLKDFTMKQFDKALIIEFLEWLRKRGVSVSTANQRLAAIKTFAEYACCQHIEYMAPLQLVHNIKSKKTSGREIVFLSVDQTAKLINKPDINTSTGLRHRTVMTLLYDSGCRVQELCDIRIRDVYTGTNPTVRLHGKGNKYRTVAISEKTAKLVSEYIRRQRNSALDDEPLIVSRTHEKLSRDGVNYIIGKYVSEIRRNEPNFPEKVHAHGFRHSKAMHMLAAGINIVYIRDFLGHEDISTTMIYSRADNRLKNEAINKLAPQIAEETQFQDWTKDRDLLSFLNSFK